MITCIKRWLSSRRRDINLAYGVRMTGAGLFLRTYRVGYVEPVAGPRVLVTSGLPQLGSPLGKRRWQHKWRCVDITASKLDVAGREWSVVSTYKRA